MNRNEGVLGEEYAKNKQKLEELNALFKDLGKGADFDTIQRKLEALYATLSKFESANAKSKPIISETHTDDWFVQTKRAAQAQEAHLAKEKEIAEAFSQEARNIEKVNELLAMRAHRSQMEASRPSLYRDGLNTIPPNRGRSKGTGRRR